MPHNRSNISKRSQSSETESPHDGVKSAPAEVAETQPDSGIADASAGYVVKQPGKALPGASDFKPVVTADGLGNATDTVHANRGANSTIPPESHCDDMHETELPAPSSSATDLEQTAESAREVHQPSEGTTNKIANEYATSAAHIRGTKRKTVVDTASHTTSSKRGKRHHTEAERLALTGGVIIPSSPLTSTSERRSSPRVVISQKGDSPSSLETPEYGKENLDAYPGQALRILFPTESKIPERKGVMKFLKDQKAKEAKDSNPKSFDMLCLENGELKTTAKLLTSLVYNKVIVSEDWVTQSVKAKRLLDPGPFLPKALKDTRDVDRSKVFSGLTVYFTPKLRKDYGAAWDVVHGIAKQAGATVIDCPPSKIPEDVRIDLCLASEKRDTAHVAALQKDIGSVYNKNRLSHSIMAGKHISNEEFAVTVPEADTIGMAESVGREKLSKGSKAVKGRKGATKKKK